MKGLGASPGIAIGRVYIDWREQLEIEKELVEDASLEADRLSLALETVRADVVARRGKAAWKELFDPEWIGEARRIILEEKVAAPWALQEAASRYNTLIAAVDRSGRADRIFDLRDRLNRLLLHMETVLTPDDLPGPRVLVCKNLTADDMALLREGKVIGLVSEGDTRWNHGLIAARDNHIPAVIALSSITDVVDQGDMIVVDGDSGEVEVNPPEERMSHYVDRLRRQQEFAAYLDSFIGKPCRAADGTPVVLRGNASTLADVERLVELGAGGIGLYRTEYLYQSRDRLPSAGEQFYDYKRALAAMQGLPVVFRTLDIGGDKMPGYLAPLKEDNPALGHRAIRYSLSRPELFRDQLRALLEASALGDLGIMLPLVTGLAEFRAARALLEDLKGELSRDDVPFNPNVQLGVMVETPAAAMEADLLAREADFLSIGSNDLVQYALAVDRNNPALADLYSPYSPGALRLIRRVIQEANRLGRPVSLCGEMAGDPLLIPLLYGFGLRRFSVNPPALTRTHWVVSTLDEGQCVAWADEALSLDTAAAVKKFCARKFSRYEKKE